LTGPGAGDPAPGRAAPPRTGLRDGAVGVLGLLVAGLAFRFIIAYLLPNSGFGVDIQSFQFWADDLAKHGLSGFYSRPFFHDYTPGYLYVLWLVGSVGRLFGDVGDLIKIPPILADAALAYVVWSMAQELGASRRSAWIGAFIVIVNPVSWFDSALWGQVDSVGTVVLLLALRELWRDRPERAGALAMLAALIKPQLGILIPIVAVVVIRRALWPNGGHGDEAAPVGGATAWERATQGPIRILTTAVAGLATAIVLSLPFGLSLPGLIQQLFSTAGGYPYLTVNAYNPWALVTQNGNGLAANRLWLCDSTVTPSGPLTIKIGDFVLWSSPGGTLHCDNGVILGALPAVLVGVGLFLIAALVAMALVARRPDRRTMLVGLAILAIAFFVLPTRVHERYLYPLIGIAAILGAVSVRWRVAYILSSAAMFVNMYAVLTAMGYNTPGIQDWLHVGGLVTAWPAIAVSAIAQVVVLVWSFGQLRDDRLDELAREIELDREDEAVRLASAAAPEIPVRRPTGRPTPRQPVAAGGGPPVAWSIPAAAATPRAARRGTAGAAATSAATMPAWDDRYGATYGIWEWFRERFAARPVRADRSRALEGEGGGRLDRLDVWMLIVLVISLLTVRMWRLSEPYGMHFDEVYHARTATEFLQDWRYGLSHDIYEWTHPHLAKYAMALGIEAWGGDTTDATSNLGVAVTDAAIEPRWDGSTADVASSGDRLWIATGTQVRAYDLSTRALAATLELPGARSVGVDARNHRVFVGFDTGEIRTIDTLPLDAARAAGTIAQPEANAFMSIGGRIDHLLVTPDASSVVATEPVEGTKSAIVIVDPNAASEVGRTTLDGVAQVAAVSSQRVAVANAGGLTVINTSDASVASTIKVGTASQDLEGPALGVSDTSDLTGDPIYVSVQGPNGPRVDTITGADGASAPVKASSFALPGDTAGSVFYDAASRMVHVLGSVQDDPSKAPTVYVIEPHANAVYADAALPAVPAAIVMDQNQDYPSSDRQQLLSLSASGEVGSVEIGDHALAWRIPGVLAGVLMGALIYLLARMLFKRRWIAVAAAFLTLADGMLFAQSRIGMNDSYVGLGIVAAYTLFVALWLRPGDSRRHWIAFWLGMPILGLVLGLALASKWVAAYAIGGLGLLILSRSALGRLLLIAGLILLTTVLGYIAISIPDNQPSAIPNYLFLLIMVSLTIVAVVANILHPIAWSREEYRISLAAPLVAGALILVYGLARGGLFAALKVGPFLSSAAVWALLAVLGAAVLGIGFELVGALGFGPRAGPTDGELGGLLEPPSPAPRGWLRLGSAGGLPILWMLGCLLLIPIGVYVLSYIPWAMVENHRLWEPFAFLGFQVPQWPPDHTGTGLGLLISFGKDNLTGDMYHYHNTLSSAHPASSPWWAWPFDFKPVWFYEDSFAGGTSASIYDAGNLVIWWLSIPAMAFVAWQAFKRRSAALAILAIGFACQWISWSRIDRAAFQYHYYTSLPFLVIALAYFLAELWNGASKRTWLLARVAGAVAILAPFGLWLLHRPLCGFVRVNDVYEGHNSPACPTLIPDLAITPRALAIAFVVGVGVLLLVRVVLATEDDGGGPGGAAILRRRLWNGFLVAIGITGAYLVATTLFKDSAVVTFTGIPVEPIALVVTIALLPVAAVVVTARDAHRFVVGALGVIGFWFGLWYPNISALPLPSAIHNAYQGLLPTYLYVFQFPVSTTDRGGSGPALFDIRVTALLGALVVVSVVVAYSTWTWRVALAERRREEDAWAAEEAGAG
jgi:Dolichyl-phosphate-mannose-protein mannosyltransferase/C-terminal four TMM region of protein-O-mannosyltransferase